MWKSSLFFALLFFSIFSLSINAASSESKEVQQPSDFDIWSSIQLILEKYGALGIIATVALFWYQQWSERIDRIRRSCNAILRELKEIRNSLQEEEKSIHNYYFEKSLLSENMEIRKTDYITIGLFGDWGTGKTTLMNSIYQILQNDNNSILVRFETWRYEREEQFALLPLLKTIAFALPNEKQFQSLNQKLKRGAINFIKKTDIVSSRDIENQKM